VVSSKDISCAKAWFAAVFTNTNVSGFSTVLK